ncbi:hypothetical protein ACIA5G_37865 [Amycolatopsis sp. NPDC051758]|uniref:hypothetical protein n=1 Tax=Amycolatopsis sp. NPDC051758 TaxID=3363935 RepID=UPI0037A39B9F
MARDLVTPVVERREIVGGAGGMVAGQAVTDARLAMPNTGAGDGARLGDAAGGMVAGQVVTDARLPVQAAGAASGRHATPHRSPRQVTAGFGSAAPVAERHEASADRDVGIGRTRSATGGTRHQNGRPWHGWRAITESRESALAAIGGAGSWAGHR